MAKYRHLPDSMLDSSDEGEQLIRFARQRDSLDSQIADLQRQKASLTRIARNRSPINVEAAKTAVKELRWRLRLAISPQTICQAYLAAKHGIAYQDVPADLVATLLGGATEMDSLIAEIAPAPTVLAPTNVQRSADWYPADDFGSEEAKAAFLADPCFDMDLHDDE